MYTILLVKLKNYKMLRNFYKSECIELYTSLFIINLNEILIYSKVEREISKMLLVITKSLLNMPKIITY